MKRGTGKILIILLGFGSLLTGCGGNTTAPASSQNTTNSTTNVTNTSNSAANQTSTPPNSQVQILSLSSDIKQFAGDSFDPQDDIQMSKLPPTVEEQNGTVFVTWYAEPEVFTSIEQNGKWIISDKKVYSNPVDNSAQNFLEPAGNEAFEFAVSQDNSSVAVTLIKWDANGQVTKQKVYSGPYANQEFIAPVNDGEYAAVLNTLGNKWTALLGNGKSITFTDAQGVLNNRYDLELNDFLDTTNSKFFYHFNNSTIGVLDLKSGKPLYDSNGQAVQTRDTAASLAEDNNGTLYLCSTEGASSNFMQVASYTNDLQMKYPVSGSQMVFNRNDFDVKYGQKLSGTQQVRVTVDSSNQIHLWNFTVFNGNPALEEQVYTVKTP